MGEYNKSSMIRYTRKYVGMTQEEVAENICDPVTIARYESGVIEPTDEKFYQIMNKMGMSGELYVIPISSEAQGEKEEKNVILNLIERREYVLVEQSLERLQKNPNFKNSVENQQFFQRVKTISEYKQKIISAQEAIMRLENAMQLTMDYRLDKELPLHRIYTENEILILNNLATIYWEKGQREKGMGILENVEKYYEQKVVVSDYKPRYIILLSYSNMLGQLGRYKECIEICKRGIRWLNSKNKTNYLYNFYFNIGWVYLQIAKEGNIKEEKEIAKMYLWVSYKLCNLFPESIENAKIISEVIEQNLNLETE